MTKVQDSGVEASEFEPYYHHFRTNTQGFIIPPAFFLQDWFL